jgi:hypothetical protein
VNRGPSIISRLTAWTLLLFQTAILSGPAPGLSGLPFLFGSWRDKLGFADSKSELSNALVRFDYGRSLVFDFVLAAIAESRGPELPIAVGDAPMVNAKSMRTTSDHGESEVPVPDGRNNDPLLFALYQDKEKSG